MSDRIKVPFVFVPHGEEPDPAALARLSDPIRVPARFVPRTPAASLLATGEADAGPADVKPDAAGPGPAPAAHDRADPVADFLRVDAHLTRAGFAEAVGARGDGRPAASGPGYVAQAPLHWIGRPSVGTGECVALVEQATGAPRSALWRPGAPVQANRTLRPGAAIATFDDDGHYTGHAAIYLGQDARGIRVIDQWNERAPDGHITGQHTPSERTISFNSPGHTRVNRGESYRVVE